MTNYPKVKDLESIIASLKMEKSFFKKKNPNGKPTHL